MVRVAVLGAGVVGLSTALNIQTILPEADVTVIADKYDKNTTSYGCGGIFLPTTPQLPADSEEHIRQWSRDSWKFYEHLVTSEEAGEAGAMAMTGYYIYRNKPKKSPLYKEFVFSCRDMDSEEMERIGFQPQFKYGIQVTTIVLNQERYLPWLMNRIKQNGGRFEKRTLLSLEKLVGRYDVCVNCTGLGSNELMNDPEVYPVRGHLVKVEAPWIKHWYFTEDRTYIIPNESFVNLGGINQAGDGSLSVKAEESKDIIDRCRANFPFTAKAKVKEDWVGLRPFRKSVRLESKTQNFKTGSIKCVHHYGHGSNGVALSWGTSLVAAGLVQQLVTAARL